MEAGITTVSLPHHGAGVYLYRLKAGNNEVLFKATSIDAFIRGTAVSTSLKITLAKNAMAASAINDVIVVKKSGYLNYRCVQYNADTAGIEIKMLESAGSVKDVDGNVYQTVQIGSQIWTVENLKTTRYNDSTSITYVSDSSTWRNLYLTKSTTGAFCYYDDNAANKGKHGILYNWYVVNPSNPKVLAPAGWHVPTIEEWDALQTYLIDNGYKWDGTTMENKIAKSLAAKMDWEAMPILKSIGYELATNNRTGFSALPGGKRNIDADFFSQYKCGYWWSATEVDSFFAFTRGLDYSSDRFLRGSSHKICGYSVRLLKN
jgi:uncharacterized protein (TIGR02145 family)